MTQEEVHIEDQDIESQTHPARRLIRALTKLFAKLRDVGDEDIDREAKSW